DVLIRSGADLALKDADGRTAMTWAERTRRADVVAVLKRAGAPAGAPRLEPASSHPLPTVRAAAERGLAALERGGQSWNDRRACASCHHAALMVPVAAVAKRRGFAIDGQQIAEHERRLRLLFSGFGPLMRDTASGEEPVVRFSLGFFGQMASGGAWLMA